MLISNKKIIIIQYKRDILNVIRPIIYISKYEHIETIIIGFIKQNLNDNFKVLNEYKKKVNINLLY